ncbi:MAG: hypothetical protein E7428_03985 [Ruminococcaceae bacterium]|nr:hypothetical protein [Oscillospiraceae bacterium]
MPTQITAQFNDVNTADLALRDLENLGISVTNRQTHSMLFPGSDRGVTNMAFGEADRFSPPPLQDGGTLLSMRIPTVVPFDVGNTLHDRVSGRVQVSLTVPDDDKSRAEACLVNRGGSHVRLS